VSGEKKHARRAAGEWKKKVSHDPYNSMAENGMKSHQMSQGNETFIENSIHVNNYGLGQERVSKNNPNDI